MPGRFASYLIHRVCRVLLTPSSDLPPRANVFEMRFERASKMISVEGSSTQPPTVVGPISEPVNIWGFANRPARSRVQSPSDVLCTRRRVSAFCPFQPANRRSRPFLRLDRPTRPRIAPSTNLIRTSSSQNTIPVRTSTVRSRRTCFNGRADISSGRPRCRDQRDDGPRSRFFWP